MLSPAEDYLTERRALGFDLCISGDQITAFPVIEQALAIPTKRFDRPVLGFLSPQEMHAIIEAPKPRTWAGLRDRALFSLMYNTGARVSEVTGLLVGDVVTDGTTVAHLRGRGRKDRSVPLWRSTTSLIRDWKRQMEDTRDEQFLFPSRAGDRMARSNVTQRFNLAVSIAAERHPQLARRSISPHTIRHATAMHFLQSSVDITVITLWRGHESPTTTHMYLEADLSMKELSLKPAATNRSAPRPISASRPADAIPSEPLNYAQFVVVEIADASALQVGPTTTCT